MSQIPLALTKRASTLDNIILLEFTDPNLVNAVIDSEEFKKEYTNKYSQTVAIQQYTNISHQLRTYNSIFDKKIGAYKVQYKKPRHRWGRVHPKGSLGFTCFGTKIRNTLMYKNYIDIDVENAQIVIIQNIAKSNNIELSAIDHYCDNRDEILKEISNEYNVSRKKAKKLFLQLSFFGTFESWCRDNNIEDVTKTFKFVEQFDNDIKTLYDILKPVNNDLYEMARKHKQNVKGCFLSLYLQEYETRIMECAINYLMYDTEIMNFKNNDKYKVGTYEYDGIKLLKQNVDRYGIDNLINDLQNVVKEKMGFNIKFVQKEIGDWVDLQYKPTITSVDDVIANKDDIVNGVMNDAHATEKLYSLYKHWVYCLGELYVFDDKTGLWSTDRSVQRNIIMRYSDDLHLLGKKKDGSFFLSERSYGNTESLINKILILISSMCNNNDWLTQNENSSLGMLLFKNGILDMKHDMEFKKDFNPKIVFFERINREFKLCNEEDVEYMEDIKQRFFYNILGKSLGDYYILQIARGLMGDVMKRLLFSLGDTGCGKSVLTNAIRCSIGGYYADFNAENLLYSKSSADEGAKLRWALLLRSKRIIISNEMKTGSVLNGNMLKKVSSGGDSLTGRVHGGLEKSFKPHFLTICMANDLCPIKPYDSAVEARVKVISYKKQFVDNVVDEETELKKDDDIDEEILNIDFQNCFLMMLIQSYEKYKEDGEPEEPEEVDQGKTDWIEDDENTIDKLQETFIITDNKEHFLESSALKDWIKDNDMRISTKKLGMEISKYCKKKKKENVMSCVKRINGKNVRGWVGIKGDGFI